MPLCFDTFRRTIRVLSSVMDLLGGYSDDEEPEDITSQEKLLNPITSVASLVSNITHRAPPSVQESSAPRAAMAVVPAKRKLPSAASLLSGCGFNI